MMSRINRNNYESYLIDLMEGNLDAPTTKEIKTFLEENPDIKEEFEQLDNISIEPGEIRYIDKQILKKEPVKETGNISENNYEEMFVAYFEGDLTPAEKEDVKHFIDLNPSLKNDFNLFGELFLSSDESVLFPDKESLYHKKRIVPLFWITSVAATLLILIAISGLVKNNTNHISTKDNGNIVQVITVSDSGINKVIVADKIVIDSSQHDKLSLPDTASVIKKVKNSSVQREPVHSGVREYIALSELPAISKNIKLIDDEVYFRFRYTGKVVAQETGRLLKRKSFVGKVMATFFKDAKKKIEPMSPGDNNEPLLARVFDGGAHVLNNYTGTEANVTKYYNNQGRLVAYHFSGGQIKFSKRFKN